MAASELGVDLVATTVRAVRAEDDPLVYDARRRCVRGLAAYPDVESMSSRT